MIVTNETVRGMPCAVLSPSTVTEKNAIAASQSAPFSLAMEVEKDSGKLALIQSPSFSAMLTEFARDRFSKEVVDLCSTDESATLHEWIESIEQACADIRSSEVKEGDIYTLTAKQAMGFFASLMTKASIAMEDLLRSGANNLSLTNGSMAINLPIQPVRICLFDCVSASDLEYLETLHKYNVNPEQCLPNLNGFVESLLPSINQFTNQENNLEILQHSFAYWFLRAYPDLLRSDPGFIVDYKQVVFYVTRTKWK